MMDSVRCWGLMMRFVVQADRGQWTLSTCCNGEMSSTAQPDGHHPFLTARTPGKRCTSLMKFASRGEVLSLRHTRDSARGMSKSTTGKMTIV